MFESELMINDWVSVIENDENLEGICRISGGSKGFAIVQYPDGTREVKNYDEIFPICLTMDILRHSNVFFPENNRLMQCEESFFSVAQVNEDTETYGENFRVGRYPHHYHFTHDYVDTDDLLGKFMPFYACVYVHQLQQAMRAYGPNTAECADEFNLRKQASDTPSPSMEGGVKNRNKI